MLKSAGTRAHYTEEFKRQVVAEAMAEGSSVAAVARKHGLNANLLFGWRRDRRYAPASAPGVQLMPVTLIRDEPPAPAPPLPDAPPRQLEIAFGDRVRIVCAEEISEPALQRLARVFGRGA